MNYYERHLGDYAKDTGHLTLLEHGVYTILLDRYYGTEEGIPDDQAHRIARARTEEERQAVDSILREFFHKEQKPNGICWVNKRADEEIAKALIRINAAHENGKKGGRPRKVAEKQQETVENKPAGLIPVNPNVTQQKAHHTPDTIIRTPIVPKGTDEGKGVDRINGLRPECREVLQFLNTETGRGYEEVDSNLKLIADRLREGRSVDQLKVMIRFKVGTWLKDEKMSQYLRPATLFNATKCAQYVGEATETKPEAKNDWI